MNAIERAHAKALTASIKDLSKDYVELANSVRGMGQAKNATRKLWKTGSKPILIKVGLALLVFPEPIVSDMLGTALLAAGAVQEGIRRQSVFLDDLPKAFQSTMKNIRMIRDLL